MLLSFLLQAGDKLHDLSKPSDEDKKLFPRELSPIVTLPNDEKLRLLADHEALVYGPIHGSSEIGYELVSGLIYFFGISDIGVLSCADYSFALMLINGRYWIFDSHSKNKEGFTHHDGTAVLIQFSSIQEIATYLRQIYSTETIYNVACVQFLHDYDVLGTGHSLKHYLLDQAGPSNAADPLGGPMIGRPGPSNALHQLGGKLLDQQFSGSSNCQPGSRQLQDPLGDPMMGRPGPSNAPDQLIGQLLSHNPSGSSNSQPSSSKPPDPLGDPMMGRPGPNNAPNQLKVQVLSHQLSSLSNSQLGSSKPSDDFKEALVDRHGQKRPLTSKKNVAF